MKKIYLNIVGFSFILLSINCYGQSVGIIYGSSTFDKSSQIYEVNTHNSFTLFTVYKKLWIDLSYESIDLFENAHRTDGFTPSTRTFYGYNAKGNRNSLTFLALGLGTSLQTLKYLRFNAGLSLGVALKKEIEIRVRDEEGAFLSTFNPEGAENINSLRLRLFQSIVFEKSIYNGTKIYFGYELSTALNPLVEIGNSEMPNSSMSDLFNSYLQFGLVYSISDLIH